MCLLPKTVKNLFFFFSLCWLLDKFGRKFTGLLYGTIEEVGCQLLNILVIATCLFLQWEGTEREWIHEGKKFCNSNAESFWIIIRLQWIHETCFVIPGLISCLPVCLSVGENQTVGPDFVFDIRCHRWFSLCLTPCQNHYCPYWERHLGVGILLHTWQNG